ncbi:MlaD family protein [Corallococcus carmarthensis]|uniref:MCE family protein n=1 Tax=Corallococcus carmarthensis TaxID=2316728 RepID=A0A3A8K4L2_9BACT|nr:MlaD family protein [Corallococcus carmarthensis]NOK18224.1 MCE family protein [Corallococcus carmarthensis]RKH02109.1 MCE family protein [Corallococcus carmarthensis]
MSLFTSTSKEKRLAVRAGLFVAVGLAVAGVVVFFIGRESNLFQRQVIFHAYFQSVDGLSDQSPVWIGGLKVGRVNGVSFSPDLKDSRLQVEFQVASAYANRIRADSVARLTSMGVLGDKAVDISLGSADQPAVEPGGVIKSSSGGDLSTLMSSASRVMENSVEISESLKDAVKVYTNPQLSRDLAKSVASLRSIMEEVEKGNGALHALIYDPRTGQEVNTLLANASGAARRMDGALGHVEAILGEVRRGDGTAHALIYGQDGAVAMRELGEAAGQLAGLLEDAKKSPNGAVHQLIYGDAKGMFADLGSAAADIKTITATVAKGDGTLGALVNDPTVYDDLREVLGNVKRNRILRALVRFSVSNHESLDQVGAPQTAPTPLTPAADAGAAAAPAPAPASTP